jgi:hypothetical protein
MVISQVINKDLIKTGCEAEIKENKGSVIASKYAFLFDE